MTVQSQARRMSLSNIRTKTKIMMVAICPLLLILAVGVFTVVDLGRMARTSHKLETLQDTLVLTQDALVTVVDMEAGLRGYLLAGQDGYLKPFHDGQAKSQHILAKLKEQISASPDLVQKLELAEKALNDWQNEVAKDAVALRRNIGDAPSMNDMAALVKKAKGKEYFDAFRLEIARFIREEEGRLEGHRQMTQALVSAGTADVAPLVNSMTAVEQQHMTITRTKDLLAAAVNMETGLRGFLLAGDPSFLEPYQNGAEEFDQIIVELEAAVHDQPVQLERLMEIKTIISGWRTDVVDEDLALRREVGDAKTMDDMADFVAQGRGKVYFDAFHRQMTEIQDAERTQVEILKAESHSITEEARTLIPLAIAVAVAVGSIMSLWIGTNIANGLKPITTAMDGLAQGNNNVDIKGQERGDEVGDMARALEVFRDELSKMQAAEQRKAEGRDAMQTEVVNTLSTQLSKLAQGDLSVQIVDAFPEDYEQLRMDFNETVVTLQQIVDQVLATTSSIRNGAEEISLASDDLSHRTESQAATLEETAAALDELTASVRAAADSAQDVENTTSSARGEAEDSERIVKSAVAAMTEIEQSSSHIAKIISVIDDIAFQTNLLALNAGVEAARAGEAGRGFAVVASEVRALAQRSSDAAMEIKTLIGASSAQVEQGVDLVGKAGVALQAILDQVGNISELVSGIATGASEQSTGLHEINTGMTQLDQVTQQNAAMVEQATAASHILKSDAAKLGELMSHFDGSAATPASIATQTPPPAQSGDTAQDWDETASDTPALAATGTDASDPKWTDF